MLNKLGSVGPKVRTRRNEECAENGDARTVRRLHDPFTPFWLVLEL